MRFAALLLGMYSVAAAADPSREDVLAAMRKAADFYANKVSTGGGYHFYYSDDLSYGRSEQGEGPTQIETQREGTPIVGMSFLEAYAATKDPVYLEAARKAAYALVAGQLCSGGWDYIVEFDPEKRKRFPYRADGCSTARGKTPTTLDDNVTQASLRLLMRVDRALGFKDAKIHEAALFGLDSLAKSQYPNGAWPQRYAAFPDPAKYPVKKASYPADWPRKWPGTPYYDFYTFNDGALSDAIDTMLEAARLYKEPRYLASAERGGSFILLAQMPDPQPAWAQQYNLDMHPAWARQFEPPSITGGETQSIIRTLLVLYRETGKKEYLDAVPRALEWLEKSAYERGGRRVLARFYELQTNKPLYITKGTQIQVKGGPTMRPDGYELSYSDESVIRHYAVVVSAADLPDLRRDYEAVLRERVPRPETLHGLSPWRGDDTVRKPSAAAVEKMIAAMDERGAWVESGVIGKADRVVSVQPARDMILTINGKPVPVKEDDRIELFQGTIPPRARIIRSSTFARNLQALAAYVAP